MCLNSAKTGDTVTVTLKSSNIFVLNIPHTISPLFVPPKLHNWVFDTNWLSSSSGGYCMTGAWLQQSDDRNSNRCCFLEEP